MYRATVLTFAAALGLTVADLAVAEATKATIHAQPEIVIEEVDWAVLADEPSQHLARAKENIIKENYQAAATDVRKAAAYLRAAGKEAVGETKTMLNNSEKELRAIAEELSRGKATAADKFDAAAARAVRGLAEHHVDKATESLARHGAEATGRYLDAAAREVAQCTRWTGRKLENGTVAALNGVRTLCGKLIEGTGYVTDETGKAISVVGSEVHKLGEATVPRP